mmetsp:Transcript_10150/g.22980  ORF Transcript_10150/g.22980 Transcript_10150/m.22980 type:complete len:429 (-) Transcript_10150:20-1306(-)
MHNTVRKLRMIVHHVVETSVQAIAERVVGVRYQDAILATCRATAHPNDAGRVRAGRLGEVSAGLGNQAYAHLLWKVRGKLLADCAGCTHEMSTWHTVLAAGEATTNVEHIHREAVALAPDVEQLTRSRDGVAESLGGTRVALRVLLLVVSARSHVETHAREVGTERMRFLEERKRLLRLGSVLVTELASGIWIICANAQKKTARRVLGDALAQLARRIERRQRARARRLHVGEVAHGLAAVGVHDTILHRHGINARACARSDGKLQLRGTRRVETAAETHEVRKQARVVVALNRVERRHAREMVTPSFHASADNAKVHQVKRVLRARQSFVLPRELSAHGILIDRPRLEQHAVGDEWLHQASFVVLAGKNRFHGFAAEAHGAHEARSGGHHRLFRTVALRRGTVRTTLLLLLRLLHRRHFRHRKRRRL